jgi:hypothetical protein
MLNASQRPDYNPFWGDEVYGESYFTGAKSRVTGHVGPSTHLDGKRVNQD